MAFEHARKKQTLRKFAEQGVVNSTQTHTLKFYTGYKIMIL